MSENGTTNGHANGALKPGDDGPLTPEQAGHLDAYHAGEVGILPSSDGSHDREDLRMLQRAIRQHWILPSDCDVAVPKRAQDLATSKAEGATVNIAAMRVLVEMKGQNQRGDIAVLESMKKSEPERGDVYNTVNILDPGASTDARNAARRLLGRAAHDPSVDETQNGHANGTPNGHH